MPEWVWAIIAGLVLAVVVPSFRFTTKAIARAIVDEIRLELGIEQMKEDIAYCKNELSTNAGETVKDRIFSIERQIEQIITTRG